jgi:hypothetical protein
MSTSAIAKHDLSVHRTILDEIDADRRAAYLFWTLRRPSSALSRYRKNCCATPAKSAALVVQRRPHLEAPAQKGKTADATAFNLSFIHTFFYQARARRQGC